MLLETPVLCTDFVLDSVERLIAYFNKVLFQTTIKQALGVGLKRPIEANCGSFNKFFLCVKTVFCIFSLSTILFSLYQQILTCIYYLFFIRTHNLHVEAFSASNVDFRQLELELELLNGTVEFRLRYFVSLLNDFGLAYSACNDNVNIPVFIRRLCNKIFLLSQCNQFMDGIIVPVEFIEHLAVARTIDTSDPNTTPIQVLRRNLKLVAETGRLSTFSDLFYYARYHRLITSIQQVLWFVDTADEPAIRLLIDAHNITGEGAIVAVGISAGMSFLYTIGAYKTYKNLRALFTQAEVVETQSRKADWAFDPIKNHDRKAVRDSKADIKRVLLLSKVKKIDVYTAVKNPLYIPFKSEDTRGKLLFDMSTYCGKPVPPTLANIRVEDGPRIVRSISKFVPDLHNPSEASQYKEMKRGLDIVLTSGSVYDDSNVSMMRDLIFDVYSKVPTFTPKDQFEYVLPNKVIYTPDVNIPFLPFDSKHFVDTFSNKGKLSTPKLLTINGGRNELFDIVNEHYKVTYALSPRVVKSIIRTCLNNGKTHDDIIGVLTHKCYLWKGSEPPCWSKLSWFFNYVPPEVYHYDIHNSKKFF